MSPSDQRQSAPPSQLPPLLMTSDPSPFIQHTLDHRWTTIARRVATENDFSPEAVCDLDALIQDLTDGAVRPLRDDGGADLADWAAYTAPFGGRSWRDLPWYFAEAYFYRRILEATRFFTPGACQGIDPFTRQKQTGLALAKAEVQQIAAAFGAFRSEPRPARPASALTQRSHLALLLQTNLWGNQADLSLRPTQAAAPVQTDALTDGSRILVNDAAVVVDRLLRERYGRIDLIADNAGVELVSDLALVDLLLAFDLAQTVHLHLKPHPTFVSDATIEDAEQTIAALAADEFEGVQQLAARLRMHLGANRLQLCAHAFWTSPLTFGEMPPDLYQDLTQAGLVIVKGDANYRRLLGDRHWHATAAIGDITRYFPAPFAALRTLKSEIVVGLALGQAERISQHDPDWLTNGTWGVIQFVDPAID